MHNFLQKEREKLAAQEPEERLLLEKKTLQSNVYSDSDGQDVRSDGGSDVDCEDDFKSNVTKARDPTEDLGQEIQRILQEEQPLMSHPSAGGEDRAKYQARYDQCCQQCPLGV